jgi:hypothetical protein
MGILTSGGDAPLTQILKYVRASDGTLNREFTKVNAAGFGFRFLGLSFLTFPAALVCNDFSLEPHLSLRTEDFSEQTPEPKGSWETVSVSCALLS